MRIDKTGDCDIILEYGGLVRFYKTNLLKVEQVIEIPSGEVVIISHEHTIYLSAISVVEYDTSKHVYYFSSEDKWQVEPYEL